jgi:hypothetical protein
MWVDAAPVPAGLTALDGGNNGAMRIAITGTRDLPDPPGATEALLEEHPRPYAAAAHGFFVGGAVGVDTHALEWLLTRRAPITVVVPATIEDQPAPARDRIRQAERAGLAEVVELRHPDFPKAEAYHARNRWMVDRSELIIGFPLAGRGGGGTWSTLDYAAWKDMPRLIIPIGAPDGG